MRDNYINILCDVYTLWDPGGEGGGIDVHSIVGVFLEIDLNIVPEVIDLRL